MTDPASLNKLGCEYFAKQKWQEAVDAFQQVIALRADYLEAYYNLGLALNKMNRSEQALVTWRALLELSPQHLGANFQIACLLMQQSKFSEALAQFAIVEKKYPTHIETLANIATCCLQLGRLKEAKKYYAKVLTIVPDEVQTLYNLGVVYAQQGTLKEAIHYYLRAVAIEPNFFAAQNNLGAAYLALRDRDAAKTHFAEALRIQPANEAIRHILTILSQKNALTEATPQSYVSSLFDSYADHYDEHLSQSLQYQVPAQMYDIVHHAVQIQAHQWDIIDLGCGTGLCGKYFRPAASQLIGVDLSERMLEVARSKQIYDTLINTDALEFLQRHRAAYNLIMAGDTLVYMGDLAAIFSAAYQALKSDGYFVFNTEISENDPFYLTPTGRFAHSKAYLDQLIIEAGFQVLAFRIVVLRMQDGQPVRGYLYFLQAYSHRQQ
jgi:predicted TPR repeat methyltransferase